MLILSQSLMMETGFTISINKANKINRIRFDSMFDGLKFECEFCLFLIYTRISMEIKRKSLKID